MHFPEAKDWHFDIDRHLNPYLPPSPTHRLPKPVRRFLGYRDSPRQGIGNLLVAGWAFFGAFVGIIVIEAVLMIPAIQNKGVPIVVASFGAAAILEFNTIESPLAQPRNTIFGHFFAAIIGVGITKLFLLNPNFESLRWIAGALACGLASAAMTLTKTIHPPAGATALLAAVDPQVQQLGWYLLPLILLSTALILATSLVINNIQRQYPTYWWTPADLSRRKKADDVEKSQSSSNDSLNSKIQPLGDTERSVIKITREGIVIPDYIRLAEEEIEILEILHQRLGSNPQGIPAAAAQH